MQATLERVPTNELKPGLYVERLDRPWTDTPFLFQGFTIRDQDEIETLQRYCEYVFVDAYRSSSSGQAEEPVTQRPQGEQRTISAVTAGRSAASDPMRSRYRGMREPYERSVPVESEIAVAEKLHAEAGRVANAILSRLQETGKLDIDLAKEIIEPMMASVLRNPDAMIWLSRMRRHDSYIYHHSVNCSIWGLAFARHLRLDREAIYEIGLGCMLFDVGKTRLPTALLVKPNALSAEERQLARAHVQHSLSILDRTGGVTDRVTNMVHYHHERYDGSGYPEHLVGDQIPTFAKIAGIVDCYDALTSVRPYAHRRAPFDALREISDWREELFQAAVIEQFMQVVGVFPTGSLIELNTGVVGVVIAQNEVRRLRPRVMLLLDQYKRRLEHFEIVDMLCDNPWCNSDQFWIDKHLPAGAYGIDAESLYL